MKLKMPIDTREFTAAMREYGRATKKDEAEILNRAGRNVAFRAAQFTPQANPAKIKGDLARDNLAVKILAKRGAFRGVPNSKRAELVRKLEAARIRSIRYVRQGWANAILAFGGRPGRLGNVNSRSEAAKGYGLKASAQRLVAELANNSRGADKVGLEPLQKAIDFVAKDMLAFAQKKLAQTAAKFSARR